jgi:hypothetical protein
MEEVEEKGVKSPIAIAYNKKVLGLVSNKPTSDYNPQCSHFM